MVHSLLDNAVSITLDFIQTNVVQMIKDGYLDIKPDRLHFISDEAIKNFMQSAFKFYERVVDYVIENKEIIRILMLESLKSGKHQNSLFRFMKFMIGDEKIQFLKQSPMLAMNLFIRMKWYCLNFSFLLSLLLVLQLILMIIKQ